MHVADAGFEGAAQALRASSATSSASPPRIALRQVRPRELVACCFTLQAAALAAAPAAAEPCPDALRRSWPFDRDIAEPRCWAVADEPAVLLRDGGVIATGVDAELDELRGISQNCDAFLLDLEQRERERTGIANLRVQFNKVHGFYIEVTSNLDRVPADYQRRQTLKNAERFITPELKAFEDKALSAQSVRWRARSGCTSSCWTRCSRICGAVRAGAARARWTRWPRWPSAPPR